MKIFLDTEFTDFHNPELISIALVPEEGDSFYAEVSDYDRAKSSDFVKQNVEPLLTGQNRMLLWRLGDKIAKYLYDIEESIEIVVDYVGDWYLLFDVLREFVPEHVICYRLDMLLEDLANKAAFFLNVERGTDEYKGVFDKIRSAYFKAYEEYFNDRSMKRHFALDDANAMKYALKKATKVADQYRCY